MRIILSVALQSNCHVLAGFGFSSARTASFGTSAVAALRNKVFSVEPNTCIVRCEYASETGKEESRW
jgi:hypothetical protein